ncbi:LOB domain-containing protein 12-like [Sesamum indicum]|uniref:LOB domain-containing protein 12-like n=1 Tax=Sesamum indicum TaxID=4182 RepID=A0A6I9TIV7_SESIN|nr:LOB domain-containing protein 12-like [Sesamum indicum]
MGGSGTAGNSPCASCKLLRRRCAKDCVFAPHFPSDHPHKFAIVHKVFGASNISKMLQELPLPQRADAVSSLVYEATARVRDPVYGCTGAISYLQSQVAQLQMQLALAQAEILCNQIRQDQQLLPNTLQYLNETATQNNHMPQFHNFTSFDNKNVICSDSFKKDSVYGCDLVS